ncbi:MAG: hypothetical protein A4E42_00369 [Methanoregulaceae archaeon PtaU1.Bin222]|nr:MAG: hypothetical protein A4E42_00369 [Methanoregulaceae archaeon PtaU1.Bin222]
MFKAGFKEPDLGILVQVPVFPFALAKCDLALCELLVVCLEFLLRCSDLLVGSLEIGTFPLERISRGMPLQVRPESLHEEHHLIDVGLCVISLLVCHCADHHNPLPVKDRDCCEPGDLDMPGRKPFLCRVRSRVIVENDRLFCPDRLSPDAGLCNWEVEGHPGHRTFFHDRTRPGRQVKDCLVRGHAPDERKRTPRKMACSVQYVIGNLLLARGLHLRDMHKGIEAFAVDLLFSCPSSLRAIQRTVVVFLPPLPGPACDDQHARKNPGGE